MDAPPDAPPPDASPLDAAVPVDAVDAPVAPVPDASPPDAPLDARRVVTILPFCPPYAAAVCARLEACAPLHVQEVFGDRPTCERRTALRCTLDASLPGSGLDAATSAACAAALPSASCDELLDGAIPACRWSGARPDGAGCSAGLQCASGHCPLPDAAACGTCAARVALGAVCTTNEECAWPLRCSLVGRCAPAEAEGAFCNETRPCREPVFVCRAGDSTCQRRARAGEPCNEDGSAPPVACERGLLCRPSASGSCFAIQFARAGERCAALPFGRLMGCGGSGACVESVCRPPGEEGEPCTLAASGEARGCLPPARCVRGVCALPDPGECP
jgi:hypothetical protein